MFALTSVSCCENDIHHYSDVVMGAMASQITGVSIVYSIVFFFGIDQRKHQSSASPAFVRGIHLSPVNSPHKGPVTRIMFPFDIVIMTPNGPACICGITRTNWTMTFQICAIITYTSIRLICMIYWWYVWLCFWQWKHWCHSTCNEYTAIYTYELD